MRRREAESDTAPAGVGVVPCALGRPWVAVRGHYGSLPSMAGRERAKAGESRPDGPKAARNPRAEGRARPEAQPLRQKSRARRAARRCAVRSIGESRRLLLRASRRAAIPHCLRDETASHLGRFAPRDRGGVCGCGEAAKDFADQVFLLTIGK